MGDNVKLVMMRIQPTQTMWTQRCTWTILRAFTDLCHCATVMLVKAESDTSASSPAASKTIERLNFQRLLHPLVLGYCTSHHFNTAPDYAHVVSLLDTRAQSRSGT